MSWRRIRRTALDLHRDTVATGAFWPSAPSLLFLLLLIIPAWMGDGPVIANIGITVLALGLGLLLLYAAGVRQRSPRVRGWWLVATWLVVGGLTALIGGDVLYLSIFIIMIHGVIVPWRYVRVVVPVLATAGLIAGLLLDNIVTAVLALVGAAIAMSIGLGIERSLLQQRLIAAENRNAVLAVAAERERIGRDLHDILGHSLTTITINAQLGRRLLATDPAEAAEQFAQIERISRQALSDVRATSANMRQVRVATEIASARSVLAAAGITAEVPAALPPLSDERAELFGYVVREAVTNMVRHSGASACTITVTAAEVIVADNGRGLSSGVGAKAAGSVSGTQGSGIEGLRERVEGAGGSLVLADPGEGDTATGTVLTVRMSEPDDAGSPESEEKRYG